jgi:mannose-6-phosphate isomerase-like protein (cupin superfamily)
MLKSLKDCEQFIAGDGSILRELLHPDKADVHIRYSLARATVAPGCTTTPHKLKSSEVYYIIAGKGLVHIDDKSFEVGPGFTVYIRPNSVQYIENTGDDELIFLCIVDPAWRQKDEQVLDG